MNNQTRDLCKNVGKTLLVLLAAMALLRVGKGVLAIPMAGMGIWWAFRGSYGKALACYAFFPFLVIVNPFVVPKSMIMGHAMRFGPLLIGLVLCMMAQSRRGGHRLPFGGLFLYLFCAAISSIGGWSAKISFMKLINFLLFLVGIWLGTQNLQQRPRDIMDARYFFLALACILVWGSIAVLPFPAIAYPLDWNMALVLKEAGMEAATSYFMHKSSESMNLFAGVTLHSQTLAPLLSCLFAFVLCDMLFVERRISWFHLFLLIPMPVMLFMTRSRTGFFSFVVGVGMVLLYAARRIQMPQRVRAKVRQMTMLSLGILLLGLVAGEISSNLVTRWLRKTNDVRSDSRDIITAVTETRMGLYDESLREFKMNPIFGMGFQVNYETRVLYEKQKGIVLSAPVEKGLLPMMVLGEGGVVGVAAFSVFLLMFYSACMRRRYFVTITMFTTYLATNIGEATFFSPGGGGGVEWMICVLGGFMIDTLLIYRRQLENMMFKPVPRLSQDPAARYMASRHLY